MSAWCEWYMDFKGTEEEKEKMLDLLYRIEGKSRKEEEKEKFWKTFEVKDNVISATNMHAREIWGENYLYPDVNIYIMMAQEAPNANFHINSNRTYEGGGGGCETYMQVEYENHKLNFKTLCGVDSCCLSTLCQQMFEETAEPEDIDGLRIATTGKLSLFENREDFQEYIEDFGGIFASGVSKTTDYLVTNFPESTTSKVKKAKELNIPIISEIEFIQKFGDVYDFDFDEAKDVLNNITYEQFCNHFVVDADFTEELFEQCKKEPTEIGLYLCGEIVSVNGDWSEEIYHIHDDQIINNDGKVENALMADIKSYREKLD